MLRSIAPIPNGTDCLCPVLRVIGPMTTPMASQKRRVSPFTRKTADGVLDFDRGATLAASRAFETANLRQTRPIEMPGLLR